MCIRDRHAAVRAVLVALLAAGLPGAAYIVARLAGEQVFAGLYMFRNVKAERAVTAAVGSGLFAVDLDGALIVDLSLIHI